MRGGPASFRAVSPPTAPQPLAPASSTPRPADKPGSSRAENAERTSTPRGQRRLPESPGPDGEALSADDAYGPGDPAYGPPDPTWYERRKAERERERELEEEQFLADAAGEEPSGRGVFEPLSRRSGSDAAQPTSLDLLLTADGGADYEGDPLDRVKDMYLAAEAVSDTDLDRRFEELLERQRKLISAYFKQSNLLSPDGPTDQRVSVSGDRQGQR